MNVDTFVVQPFRTVRKRLVPGIRIAEKTKHHALRTAERLSGRAEGVAVLHIVADDETGEVSSLAVLARHGVIPDAFDEEVLAI